jgi:ferredoxin
MSQPIITLQPAGWAFVAEEGRTILHAAEAAGVELPSSCRNGTCRACICRLERGRVRYLVEWPGLSFDEKREGYVLPCVAVPEGDVAVEQRLARRIAWPDQVPGPSDRQSAGASAVSMDCNTSGHDGDAGATSS